MGPAVRPPADGIPLDNPAALETRHDGGRAFGNHGPRGVLEAFRRDVMLYRTNATDSSHPLEEAWNQIRRLQKGFRDNPRPFRPNGPSDFHQVCERCPHGVFGPLTTSEQQHDSGLPESVGVHDRVVAREYANPLEVSHSHADRRNADGQSSRELAIR